MSTNRIETLKKRRAKLRKLDIKISDELLQLRHAQARRESAADAETRARKDYFLLVAALEVKTMRGNGATWKEIKDRLHLTETKLHHAKLCIYRHCGPEKI